MKMLNDKIYKFKNKWDIRLIKFFDMIRSPSSSSSHSDDNFRTIDNFDNLTLPTFLLNDLYEFNLKSPTNWQA